MIPPPKDVNTKAEFVRFLGKLQADLKRNPDGWENPTLDRYLEAMASWVDDSDGYYRNTNQPVPAKISWRFFAEMLAAARMYE